MNNSIKRKNRRKRIMIAYAPVSYTHLDVYKRQDLAIAVLKKPEIISRLTAIVIAGGVYPKGGWEPNVESDLLAAQIVFDSGMNLWQIPMNVYGGSFISLAEVVDKVKTCGAIGDYLCRDCLLYTSSCPPFQTERNCSPVTVWPGCRWETLHWMDISIFLKTQVF